MKNKIFLHDVESEWEKNHISLFCYFVTSIYFVVILFYELCFIYKKVVTVKQIGQVLELQL